MSETYLQARLVEAEAHAAEVAREVQALRTAVENEREGEAAKARRAALGRCVGAQVEIPLRAKDRAAIDRLASLLEREQAERVSMPAMVGPSDCAGCARVKFVESDEEVSLCTSAPGRCMDQQC